MSEISPFDYAGLSVADQVAVQSAAVRIRDRMKRTVEDIIAIGQDLIAVKEKLAHGAFLPWINAEFGMSETAARNFIRVATIYVGKSAIIADFSPTVLYELAAPSTPEPVRQAVEAKAEAGESVSVAEVQRLKREAAEATKRTAEAEAKASTATAEADRQRAKADALAEGQRDLIEAAKGQARKDAEAKAAADLEKAKGEAHRAKSALAEQQRQLADITEKAEAAAQAKAQAEVETLAKAEFAKLDDELRKSKRRKEEAEQEVNRLKSQSEFLGRRVDELKGYIRATESEQDEAASIDLAMKKVVQSVSDAMTILQCLRHDHGAEVSRRVQQAADIFSRSAEALESRICGQSLIADAEYVAA